MVTVARDVPDNLVAYGVGMPMAAPSAVPGGGGAIAALPMTGDYSNPVIILGRVKPGLARETRRVVHVFLLTSQLPHDSTLTAGCGERVLAGDLQWLPALAGMPCEQCVLHSVTENH